MVKTAKVITFFFKFIQFKNGTVNSSYIKISNNKINSGVDQWMAREDHKDHIINKDGFTYSIHTEIERMNPSFFHDSTP